MKILVRRSGALGDVVLATPIVQRFHDEHPGADITVQTAYPDVFRGSPHVSRVVNHTLSERFDVTVNLDLAYERRPSMHIVEAYMLEAFGDTGRPGQRQQEIYFPRKRVFMGKVQRKYVAVHAATAGWTNRTLPRATWRGVVQELIRRGLWPILVGTQRDSIGMAATSFFTPDIHVQAKLIASCSCFVGSDSGLLHVAGATDTPIVGIFTCARPEYRLPWRHGQLGWKAEALVPDLLCVGCLERARPPATVESCERGDTACVDLVSANTIVDAVQRMVET